jgi:hypothetical protein
MAGKGKDYFYIVQTLSKRKTSKAGKGIAHHDI